MSLFITDVYIITKLMAHLINIKSKISGFVKGWNKIPFEKKGF